LAYMITPSITSPAAAGIAFELHLAVVATAATALPPVPPYAAATGSCRVGSEITAHVPTAAADTLYTVVPALPGGLTISIVDGKITGNPTTATAATTYVITATNSFGASATSFSLSLTVLGAAPVIKSWTQKPFNAYAVSASTAITDNLCTSIPVASTAELTFAIAPALPTGLAFSTTDGKISGTPTTAAAGLQYVITPTHSTDGVGETSHVFIAIFATAAAAVPADPAYAAKTESYTVGTAITAIGPTAVAPDSLYIVAGVLPAGLTMNPLDGQITGTPTTASAAAKFPIIALNTFGPSAKGFELSITVVIAGNTTAAASGGTTKKATSLVMDTGSTFGINHLVVFLVAFAFSGSMVK